MKATENPAMFFPMAKKFNRIKWVRDRAELTQEEFARALNTVEGVKVTRGAVGNWEREGGDEPSLKNLSAISEKFGVSLDWLQTGRGELPQKIAASVETPMAATPEKTHNVDAQQQQNARIGELVRGFSKIPIRGVAMGGEDGYVILGDQYLGDVLAPPALADIPDAYAVYMVGDSMLERYRHGEICFVHPYAPVRKDDDCVIQISMGEGDPPHGFVKRFISMDDKQLRVLQLNPRKVLTFPRSRVLAVHRVIMGGPA